MYCCDAPLHAPLYPLDYTGFVESGMRERVHSYVAVCNMRATSATYFFLRFFPSYIHPCSRRASGAGNSSLEEAKLLYKKLSRNGI